MRTSKGIAKQSLFLYQMLMHFKTKLNKQLGKDLPIFITEWNIWKNNLLDYNAYINAVNSIFNSFEAAGINKIYFWPLRKETIWHSGYSFEEIFINKEKGK